MKKTICQFVDERGDLHDLEHPYEVIRMNKGWQVLPNIKPDQKISSMRRRSYLFLDEQIQPVARTCPKCKRIIHRDHFKNRDFHAPGCKAFVRPSYRLFRERRQDTPEAEERWESGKRSPLSRSEFLKALRALKWEALLPRPTDDHDTTQIHEPKLPTDPGMGERVYTDIDRRWLKGEAETLPSSCYVIVNGYTLEVCFPVPWLKLVSQDEDEFVVTLIPQEEVSVVRIPDIFVEGGLETRKAFTLETWACEWEFGPFGWKPYLLVPMIHKHKDTERLLAIRIVADTGISRYDQGEAEKMHKQIGANDGL